MMHFIRVACVCSLVLLCSTYINAQPNITRVEYYIDTDPGFGNGTTIPLGATPGNDFPNLSFNLDISSLINGVHIVGVRTQDANGAWSHDNKWLFAKLGAATAEQPVPNLGLTEYYINTDPGFGNAIPVTTTGTPTDKSGSFTLDITSYPFGVTIIGVRTQDANKAWSHDNKWLFAKVPLENTPPNIKRVEYYFDTDPGFGNGKPLALNIGNDLPGIVINANVTGLANGKHKIFYRTQDINGAWSHDNVDSFTLSPYNAAPAIVVNSITKTTLCARDSFTVGYHATGTYNAGNIFNAEISDATGSFPTTPVIIGSTTSSENGGTILCNLPTHFADGTGYKLRISSTSNSLAGIGSQYTLTIHDRPFAQTITGRNLVNGTYTWPYTMPAATGSQWNWSATGATIAAGQTTNTVNLLWSQPATDSTIGNIYSIETNQFGCTGDTSFFGPVTIYRLGIKDTVPTAACKGGTIQVKTGSTGLFDAGNNLVAELSDSSGLFTNPLVSTSIPFTGNGVLQNNIISLPIPQGIPNSAAYRIRVRSTTPAFTGDTSAPISIIAPNLGPDLNFTYCTGRGYNLTQHFTDALLTYQYFTDGFTPLTRPDSVEAGTFAVIGSTVTGCTDTAFITITANPSPALGADTTVFHDCPGETTNLTPLFVTTGLTAQWSTANLTTAPPGTYRLVVTNSFACTDTAFAIIKLETAIWTGTISSDWHTPGNWNINKVPTDKTHVIITGTTPNPCIISTANAQAASIQARNGGTVQTINNKTADVKGKCPTLPAN